MSNLLINEYPLTVLPTLACHIGLNEAIVLQQFHYWIGRTNNVIDGNKWIYNTYTEWNLQFPFWSRSTLIRTINNLEKLGLIISGNFNKMNLDKTKWYRVDYEAVKRLEESNDLGKAKHEKKSNKTKNEKVSNKVSSKELNDSKGSERVTQNDYIELVNLNTSTTQNDHMDYPNWVDASSQNDYTNNQRLPESTTETNSETTNSFDEEEERLYYRAIYSDERLNGIAEYLIECLLDIGVVIKIILKIKNDTRLWRMDLIGAQIGYMEARKSEIFDYAEYFVNGLNKRVAQGDIRKSDRVGLDSKEEYNKIFDSYWGKMQG